MEFKFPDVGEGIHEGKIVKWKVKEGASVKEDEILAEVETDKAIVEIPSPFHGRILRLHAREGEEIKVGSVMVTFEGSIKESSDEEISKAEATKIESKTSTSSTVSSDSQDSAKKAGGVVGFIQESDEGLPIKKRISSGLVKKIQAAPAVREYANQKGIDLTKVKGTGEYERITKDDVDNFLISGNKNTDSGSIQSTSQSLSGIKIARKYDMWGFIDRVPYSGIRKVIADNTKKSYDENVHVTIMGEAIVDDLVKQREKEKKFAEEKGIKLTYLPFIIKALVNSLSKYPQLNSEIQGTEIIVKKYYNIGIAVDTGDGLYVPIIKRAEQKTVLEIAKEIDDLSSKAFQKKLDPMDFKGGSFTISNLGVSGVKFFTPIINHPQSAILGIGRMYKKPVVKNNKIEISDVLPISLVFDHRVVDGMYAAKFLEDFISNLENVKGLIG